MTSTLFTNAMIFDGTGRAPFLGEVSVAGNRIEAVVASGDQLSRDGAEVIDCHRATLMPGLIESHAHLSWPSSVGRIYKGMMLPPEEHLLVTAHNARVTLEAGFTSAYSAGSLGTRFEVALKKEIEGGWTAGPRLIASSLEQGPKVVSVVPPAEGNKHGRGVDDLDTGGRQPFESSAPSRVVRNRRITGKDDADRRNTLGAGRARHQRNQNGRQERRNDSVRSARTCIHGDLT